MKEKEFDSEDIEWITMNGNHIPILPGETKDEAVQNFKIKKIADEIRRLNGQPNKQVLLQSKLIRDLFLENGYNVIEYPNAIEDKGNSSFIVLNPDIIEDFQEIEDFDLEEDDGTYVYHYSDFPIKNIDMNKSSQIGLHFGTLKAAKDRGGRYLYKTKLKPNVKKIKSNRDYQDGWHPKEIIIDIRDNRNFKELKNI